MFQSPAGTNQTPPAGQPGNSQGQPPAVPPTVPGDGQSGDGANQTPQYATVEDVQKIVTEAVSRLNQSVKDSTTAKIEKLMATLTQEGIPVSKQTATQLVQSAEAQSSAPATSGAPIDQSGAPGGQQLDPVSAEAFEILKAAGISPESVLPNDPNDPDNKLIPWETNSPMAFLTGVKAYADAKAQRTQREGDPSRGVPPPNSPTPPAWQGKSSLDILTEGYRQSAKP